MRPSAQPTSTTTSSDVMCCAMQWRYSSMCSVTSMGEPAMLWGRMVRPMPLVSM